MTTLTMWALGWIQLQHMERAFQVWNGETLKVRKKEFWKEVDPLCEESWIEYALDFGEGDPVRSGFRGTVEVESMGSAGQETSGL